MACNSSNVYEHFLTSESSPCIISTIQDDADAVAHHKAQPHFDLWTKFKETEGINQSVSKKAYGEFMT